MGWEALSQWAAKWSASTDWRANWRWTSCTISTGDRRAGLGRLGVGGRWEDDYARRRLTQVRAL